MHTVQTDLSLTQHAYLGYAFVANQRFWESMAAPIAPLVSEALREALYFGNQIADTQNDKALVALREAGGIHVPAPAQITRMRTAVEPVHTGSHGASAPHGWTMHAKPWRVECPTIFRVIPSA